MSLLETPFTKQAGIQYPIICGAMFPCTSPELVAAASEAGGIGIVQPMSLVNIRGYDFREGLKYIRKMTSKPYGLNIILIPGYEDRLKAWTDIAIEEGCRFFITALGKPTWVIDKVHAVGGYVYHDVIKKEHALKGIDAGVDGLICVNNRAGGHAGYKSDIELYEELKDLGKPMICAGNIGDEHDFVRALKMGYAGVQMATRFIATFECDESNEYKQAIIDATENDIIMTTMGDGVPGAVIKSAHIKENSAGVHPIIVWLMRYRRTRKLMRKWMGKRMGQKMSANSLQTESGERVYSAGKSVGHIHKIEHVKDVIERFANAGK